MNLRPFRNINRKKTKVINVGDVKIGGDNPISVQSMTNTLTTDIKATINQINKIQSEGADLVRVSCPDQRFRRYAPQHDAGLPRPPDQAGTVGWLLRFLRERTQNHPARNCRRRPGAGKRADR